MTSTRLTLSATFIAVAAALSACASHSDATGASGTSGAASRTAPTVPSALTTQVFNPGEQAIFAVTSVLVEGQKDAILIDAQFSAAEARKLAERIKASGKRLTTIYISHGDPDFYFGLDTLQAAFPQAQILATPKTIAHIQETKDAKLKVWGPQLGANAPKAIVMPQALRGDTLTLEGQALQIVGLEGPTPDRTFVWIPSIQTVAGGIPVQWGSHVWMADTQTPASHAHWLQTLERIRALRPAVVIPGHFSGPMPKGFAAVDFTADYIRAFDAETPKAANSAQLIDAMKKRYPQLGGHDSLALSAKVAKGEMQWK